MQIDSFMVLACPQSCLPMMLNLLLSMGCHVACECPCMGDGCLRCSFLLSPSDWTYGVAKVLSRVIQPLVGKSPHHIQSTSDFVSKAKRFTLQLGECLSSYDVTSLFTSIPVDPALNVIRDLLKKDEKLNDRTVLLVQNIIELLGFCLHNTYFSFQNKFYEQVEGVPMGSPVSTIVVNLYMESFETKALRSANNPPGMV